MIGGIFANPVARARAIAVHDRLERGQEGRERAVVLGRLVVGTDRLDEPEGGVHGVVFRRLAGIRKPIREHPAVDEAGESREDLPRQLAAARDEGQPGQAHHRVTAPIAEPRITRDDG